MRWLGGGAISLGVGVLLLFHFLNPAPDLAEELLALGLRVDGLKKISVQSHKSYVAKAKTAQEWQGEHDLTRVNVVVLEDGADSFESYTQQRLFQISSQYFREVSPYPGAVSRETSCPENFQPRQLNFLSGDSGRGQRIEAFANSRYQLGVCDDAEKKFVLLNLILACAKTKRLFDLKIYYSVGASEPIGSGGISCD